MALRGEYRIMLLTRESLFLSRGDEFTTLHQAAALS